MDDRSSQSLRNQLRDMELRLSEQLQLLVATQDNVLRRKIHKRALKLTQEIRELTRSVAKGTPQTENLQDVDLQS